MARAKKRTTALREKKRKVQQPAIPKDVSAWEGKRLIKVRKVISAEMRRLRRENPFMKPKELRMQALEEVFFRKLNSKQVSVKFLIRCKLSPTEVAYLKGGKETFNALRKIDIPYKEKVEFLKRSELDGEAERILNNSKKK